MKQKVLFLLTLMALMMLATSLVQAKGPPDRVTISSPNLPKEITLDDQALMGVWGW